MTAAVPATRRWTADPLLLLALLAATAVTLALVPRSGAAAATWQVPALLGVVASGLALSGST